MNSGSIRTRLSVSVALIFGLSAGIAGAVMMNQLERTMLSNSEESANALLDDFASGLETGNPNSPESTQDKARFVYADANGIELTPDEFGFLLVEATPLFLDDEEITRVEPAPDIPPEAVTELIRNVDPLSTPSELITFQELVLDMGDRTTEISHDELRVTAPVSIGDQDLSLGVAQPLTETRNSLAAAKRLLLLGIPLLTALVAAMAWGVVGRVLRPVSEMASRVEQISNESLNQRLPEPPDANELGHLARTMNAMLKRLEGARDSQRRFISDASHELRSPITATKATIEVARAHPELTDWERTAEVISEENDRLAGLVDDLLLLANLEENSSDLQTSRIDLDEVCLSEVNRPHPVPVRVQVYRAARVEANLRHLTRALRNIIENGTRYAASEVIVRVDAVDGFGVIEISDDGPGIDPDLADRVFDRFARLDESRNRSEGGGAGLGLAIARQIVEAAGGTITVTNRNGAVFTIRIPLAD